MDEELSNSDNSNKSFTNSLTNKVVKLGNHVKVNIGGKANDRKNKWLILYHFSYYNIYNRRTWQMSYWIKNSVKVMPMVMKVELFWSHINHHPLSKNCITCATIWLKNVQLFSIAFSNTPWIVTQPRSYGSVSHKKVFKDESPRPATIPAIVNDTNNTILLPLPEHGESKSQDEKFDNIPLIHVEQTNNYLSVDLLYP